MQTGPGGKTWGHVVQREKVETMVDVRFAFMATGEVVTSPRRNVVQTAREKRGEQTSRGIEDKL